MLSLERTYHFKGVLHIKKSKSLPDGTKPREDIMNWFFIKIETNLFSFVYKICNEDDAEYENPFAIEIAFTAIDLIKEKIKIGNVYKVFRGQEEIGILKIIEMLKGRFSP